MKGPCKGVVCDKNTECIEGICVCLEGFLANCGLCEDINECETGNHSCNHLGQECMNLPGSYECVCKDGYELLSDGTCQDINECENVTIDCGNHAECVNTQGDYECQCCMGYSKKDNECHRNMSLDAVVYGGAGQECCVCTGDRCADPNPVCGSDGNTYANFRSLVTQSCTHKKHVYVNYEGACQDSCDKVVCGRPNEDCRETGPGGSPVCSCPNCTEIDQNKDTRVVCASNKKIYETACQFQLRMCETERHDIELEDSMDPCEGPGGPQWSDWSECNNTCGKGVQTRTRVVGGETEEEAATCYTVCEEGPCKMDTCHNPGQVCMVDESGTVVCECPDCTGVPHDYICGQVGNEVKTYPSECLMMQRACELTRYSKKLEDQPCEVKSAHCHLARNFATLLDSDNCTTDGSVNIGYCYGGCGRMTGPCCRPVRGPDNAPLKTADLVYTCPDGTTKARTEEIITQCDCIHESQHERDRR